MASKLAEAVALRVSFVFGGLALFWSLPLYVVFGNYHHAFGLRRDMFEWCVRIRASAPSIPPVCAQSRRTAMGSSRDTDAFPFANPRSLLWRLTRAAAAPVRASQGENARGVLRGARPQSRQAGVLPRERQVVSTWRPLRAQGTHTCPAARHIALYRLVRPFA